LIVDIMIFLLGSFMLP